MIYKKESLAKDLPKEWDGLIGDNIYMSIIFLSFIEKSLPEFQPTYHMLFDDENILDSIFITHPRKGYNMTMFTKFKWEISVTFVYLPMSVTRSSVVFNMLKNEALDIIKSIKGYKMMLNFYEPTLEGFTSGLTCPKCILDCNFNNFDEYLNSMRSNYRYRYKKCLQKSSPLIFKDIKAEDFTKDLFKLYENIYNNSKVKIEKLTIEYFKGDMFKLKGLFEGDKCVGFIQLLENGEELIFEFVGIDYEYNEKYDVYHRLLLEIVRYGIDNKFKSIDFGQTADDTKLKLGCRYVYLYAHLHNSNKLINFIGKKIANKIDYKPIKGKFNVFKQITTE